MIKHPDEKQLRGGKGLFGFYFQVTVHCGGKPRQELKQEREGRNCDEMLLADRLALGQLSCIGQNHPPRGDAAHSGLDPLTSINAQDGTSQTGQSDPANPSFDTFFSGDSRLGQVDDWC